MTYDTINDAVTIPGNGEGTLLANRYRIVRQLGAGGMGSVWLAEDTQLDNKQFAIKMLPAILVANKRAYRQLKDEALVAMRLVHPNIVQIRAFEENDGNPFLVMDYIDGQTLDDYLADYDSRVEHVERVEGVGSGDPTVPHGRAGSPLPLPAEIGRARSPSGPQGGIPEADVLRILKPIAAALDYAHGEGVVHRDVKPANVMIRKDGHPFILDFGIAREIQETMTRVTGKLSSGTLLYMSPEQLMGEQPRPAQDVYSFAAMVYECLKGEPPFVRGAIEDQIKNKIPEPLPGGPRSVAAAIMAGLAKKPEDRPASCTAVLEGGLSTQRREDAEAQGGRAGAPRPPQDDGGARRPAEPAGSRVPVRRSFSEGGPRDRGDVSEEDAKRARVEAKIQEKHLKNISNADGLGERKSMLAEAFQKAEMFLEEKLWADAVHQFKAYVEQVEELEMLDSERKAREEAKRKVIEEQARCGKVQLWEGGPYWATTNIGAENPWDYGYYFWWGDIVGYKREGNAWVASDGSSQNFSFGEANTPTCEKNDDTLKHKGWIKSSGVLAPEHDAAHRHWGGSWRIPTKQELDDLRSKCDWTWTKKNGVNGYIVRGKGAYASAIIFLPCAGNGYGLSLDYAGSLGCYWSCVPDSLNEYDIYYAWQLGFSSGGFRTDSNCRHAGLSVRPVQGFTK